MDKCFSWQKKDLDWLQSSDLPRICLVKCSDIESQFNIVDFAFSQNNDNRKNSVFNIVLDYDKSGAARPYRPFILALEEGLELSRKLSSAQLKDSIIEDLTKSKTLKSLANLLTIGRQYEYCEKINAYENQILVQIEKESRKLTPIIIVKNYDLFDSSSQALLISMLSGELNIYYPQMEHARFLFLREEIDLPYYASIESLSHVAVTLNEPHYDNIDEILTAFSLDVLLSSAEKKMIYELSGGLLSRIQVLVSYLNNQGEFNVGSSDFEESVRSSIELRLRSLKKTGSMISDTLGLAALIGEDFPYYLVEYVSSYSSNDVSIAMRTSEKEYFIRHSSEQYSFSYPTVRQCFINRFSTNANKAYRMLSAAIRYFSPGDFYMQAYYLDLATSYKEACYSYILAYSQLKQKGMSISSVLRDRIIKLSSEIEGFTFFQSLMEYFPFIDQMDYIKAVNILESDNSVLPSALIIKKSYLVILARHRLGISRVEMLDILCELEHITQIAKKTDLELWIECANLLISLKVNFSGDIVAAKSIQRDLAFYYSERSGFDNNARKGQFVLYRKWAAFFSMDSAYTKTKASMEFFKNTVYDDQYIMALNNHCANCIVLGEYIEAIDTITIAINILNELPSIRVNRYYILCNYFLANVCADKLTADTVCSLWNQYVMQMEPCETKIIPLINNAIYYAMVGQYDKASELLDDAELLNSEIEDDYYTYYIHANRAAIKYLCGYPEEGADELEKYCFTAPKLMKASECVALRERTEKWISIMKATPNIPANEFANYLSIKHRGNKQFLFRGFLASDIQFWSES